MTRLLPILLLPSLLLAQYVEDSIDVGTRLVGSFAYNPHSNVVYGCGEQPGAFFAISCSTNELVRSTEVPGAHYVVYDTIDRKAYCTFYNTRESDSILVVDGRTHERLRAIAFDEVGYPVWDPVSNRLYVGRYEGREVAVLDCRTDTFIRDIRVGQAPGLMYVNPEGRRLYVLNIGSESVSIIDLVSNEVVRTVRLDAPPDDGCYSPVVDKFYCGSGDIAVIDGSGDSVVAEVQMPWGAVIALAASGEVPLVLAGMQGTGGGAPDTVYAIDALGDTIVAKTVVERLPHAIRWSAATRLFYCANRSSNSLSVLSCDASEVLVTLGTSHSPAVLGGAPTGTTLYLGHSSSNMVYVIKDTVGGVAETPERKRAEPQRPTVLTRAQLQAELHSDPSSSLFDPSGRAVLHPKSILPGIYFVRRLTADRRPLTASRKVLITR